MNPRIVYVPSDMDAPGCYRCLFPGYELQARGGYEVVLPPHKLITRPDGKQAFEFQVNFNPPSPAGHIWVLQSRFDRDLATGGVQDLRQAGVATVLDVDDNYDELPAWQPAFWGTHPYRRDDGVILNREARRRVKKLTGFNPTPNRTNREWLKEAMKQVDHVTVSTPYLAELYRKYNPNISVVRNAVNWDMWRDITPQYEVERWQGRIRIGYAGVFAYRQGDLKILRPFMREFMLRHPECDFVANSKAVHDFLGIPERQRVIVKEYDFYNIKTGEYAMPRKTATMDIGLVPLTPGGLAEGKSHLKGMEYNAAGIPYIASPTESYRWFTKPENNGFLAHSESDWIIYLDWLVANEGERRRMGEYARQYVRERHTTKQRWQAWDLVYKAVLGDKYTQLSRQAIRLGAVQKVSELSNLLHRVEQIQPKTVVEVGSARGGTFWALAQVAHPEALLVSVDIPSGSPIDVREGKDVYGARDREGMRKYIRQGQRCVLIDGNSQLEETVEKLVDTIGTTKIDVLLIDADHRYEGVKRDYELYSPLVRPGGLIIFHDMIPQNVKESGVHIFWDELKKDCDMSQVAEYVGNDAWGYGQWGGVGVLVK